MKKRFLSIFMVIALAIGMITPVFADYESPYAKEESSAKISKDKAKEIALKVIKDTFNVDAQGENLDYNIDFGPDGYNGQNYVWYVSWSKYNDNQDKSFNITVDAQNGNIVGLNKYEYSYEKEDKKATITQEKAKEIAESYIKKIDEEKFKEVQYVKDYYSDKEGSEEALGSYYFRYVRMVNGVEFDRDAIYVEVDGIKGDIISYGYSWGENIEFPSTEGVISKEKALEVLKQNIEMKLSYLPTYDEKSDSGEGSNIKLVYNPDYTKGSMVEAKEGKMIDWMPVGANKKEKTKDINEAKKEEILKTAKNTKGSEKELSKEEATSAMKEKIKEIHNMDVDFNSIEFINDYNSDIKKVWSGEFGEKQGDGSLKNGGNIIINALSGDLVSSYKYEDDYTQDENFTPKLTWEQGYDKAIETIGKYFPEKIKEIKTEQIYIDDSYEVNGKKRPQRYLSFYFPREVNGLEYYDNSITVTFDAKTGDMIDLGCFWDDSLSLPDTSKAMSKEEVKKAFLDNVDLKLTYTTINKSTDYRKPNYEIKLTYMVIGKNNYPVYNIDAMSGKVLDYEGKEIK